MAAQLAEEREKWSIDLVQNHHRSPSTDAYSSTIVATGGCLSVISHAMAGLVCICGFEIEENEDARAMQGMFADLTPIQSQGDFRATDPKTIRRAKITSTGLPCPDYSTLGSGMGSQGKNGGECYLQQGKWLVRYGSDIIILEQTSNVRLQDVGRGKGKDLQDLLQVLSKAYVTYDTDVRVWEHGDVSNRTRTYIVGVHKRHGEKANHWVFPDTSFDESRYPIGADIATPDEEVPDEYILRGEPTETYPWREPKPGWIHRVGNFGKPGIGDCEKPFPLQSWLSLPNTQLVSNGGARRTMLGWQPGDTVESTRLTDIDESAKMASLFKSYVPWARQFGDGSDRFVRKCINMGEPIRTCTAIHKQAVKFLEYLGVERDVLSTQSRWETSTKHMTLRQIQKEKHANQIWKQMYSAVRSMLVDTGANGSLNKVDVESHLTGATPSTFTIGTAKIGAAMQGSKDGVLEAMVINASDQNGCKTYTAHEWETTTAEGLTTELYSMDPQYRNGRWNLKIRQPDHESGVSEIVRDARNGAPKESIPLRYDYTAGGGWWIDYVLREKKVSQAQSEQTARYLRWHQKSQTENQSRGRTAWLTHNTYDGDTADEVISRVMETKHASIKTVKWAKSCDCEASEETQDLHVECGICAMPGRLHQLDEEVATTDVVETRYPDEKEVKGTKEQLARGRAKWPYKKFHRNYGHHGNCDGCSICAMVKGVMKRYTKKVDPHRCTTPWRIVHMDAVVFSHRSLEGNKYMVTFRDEASGEIKLRFLYLRSDAPRMIKDFVNEMRADPEYDNCDKQLIKYIVTDEPGEWGLKSATWKAVKEDLKIKSIHATPETSKEMGRAEGANKVAEHTIKAMLIEDNLPPDHWEACARSAEFTICRFPNLASDVNESVDGDRASPIEIGTSGRHSRRQVHRELAYYLPTGRLALVHEPKAKGSQLKPKCRWGIAWGMYREQVVFRCPFTGSTFRSKSYFAFETEDHLNCYQFLGIPARTTTRQKLYVKGDNDVKIDVQLPKVTEPRTLPQIPIITIQSATESGVVKQNVERSERTGAEDAPDELGGSLRTEVRVHVYDADGDKLSFDAKGGQKQGDPGETHTHTSIVLSHGFVRGVSIPPHAIESVLHALHVTC